MRTTVTNYVNGLPSTTTANKLARAQAAVHLVASSPQFNNQR
jgi:hypothetical protein